MSWQTLEQAEPELAAFGRERFGARVAYLATIRKDGAPRVHPVTPIIGEGHLFLFMEPTSPKGFDLRRNGRYAIHSGVEDAEGTGGEFAISGRATFVDDAEIRKIAVRSAGYEVADRYVLFELSVERAASTLYVDGPPLRRQWRLNVTP
jgi:hypothetical protein